MTSKLPLQKETIRFYKTDMDIIRQVFPGGFGTPGINSMIREVVHTWVETNIIPKLQEQAKEESGNPLLNHE